MSIRSLLDEPLENPRLWLTLGWLDIVQSYRRTMFGPIWITLNMAIFSTAISLVYGAMFGLPTRDYVSYVVCGMIGWFWISAILMEGGNTFIANAHFIRSIAISKSQLVWAAAAKQLIVLAHNLVVYLFLVAIGLVKLSLNTLMVIPAIVIIFLMSVPLTAILSILYARYRDLPRLVGSSIIIIMLLTPIFWKADMVAGWRSAFIHFNPVYYTIEFLRRPMLGQPPDPVIIGVILAMTVIFWVIGTYAFARYQRYVVFWV